MPDQLNRLEHNLNSSDSDYLIRVRNETTTQIFVTLLKSIIKKELKSIKAFKIKTWNRIKRQYLTQHSDYEFIGTEESQKRESNRVEEIIIFCSVITINTVVEE